MDDSLYSDSAALQGSSQGTYSHASTRFGSATQLNAARNLFDESMDLDGAGTQDTDIPDENSQFHREGYYGTTTGTANQTAGPSRVNGDAQPPRLPSSEFGRMHLHEQTHPNSTTATGGTPPKSTGTSENHTNGAHLPAQEDDNDLPTVPPLSAEERRTQALTRERDDLAKMNTLLEHAVASISRTVPKMESFQTTMKKTHSLLDTYTKVLSQAEHTQNLLLDGSWEPQRDENEIREEAEAEERKQREEEERIAREQQEAEEQESRRREETERKAASGRGRGVPTRGMRGVPSTRGRASASQRGSTVRGNTRGRGTTTTRGNTRT